MIEKILERLEAEKQRLEYQHNFFSERNNEEVVEEYGLKIFQMERVLKIVQEVAKEQNSEWVLAENGKQPNVSEYCSRYFWVTITRKDSNIFVTEKLRWIGYMKRWEWSNGRELSSDYDVIAWREYFAPAPYQKGE